MANQNGQSNSRSLLLLLLTSGFFITGLLFDYMPLIVDSQIKRTVELATNEEIQSIWSRPPIDVHSYYWLYDALNVNDFLAGAKLNVRKVGPFHFTSRIEKHIIEISANKFRITYNSTRRIRLNEIDRDSNERLNEPLKLLNPIYATLVASTRELGLKLDTDLETKRMMAVSASRLAERFNETLFINSTAREALLGRKLVFLEKVRKMLDTFGIEGAAASLARAPADNIFGYVALLNNTWQGPYEIYSGYQASMASLGDLISFEGKRRLSEFRGKCNRLQASAGEMRPMPLELGQQLEIFQPNFCRIVQLRQTGQRKMREGLAYAYVIAEQDLLSAKLNPANQCYCLNGTTNDYCSLSGVLELAPCSSFSPLLLSFSHIELDPQITSSLHNWHPELIQSDLEGQQSLAPPDNRAQLLILRRIGVPAYIDLTYVVFMRVTRDPQFRDTTSVPEVSYIPAMMVREVAKIPPKLGQILVNLESFLELAQHLKVIMYVSGVVLLCWLTGNFYSHSRGGPGAAQRDSSAARRDGLSSANSSLADREANSADSSRSQPPSRRSSLTGGQRTVSGIIQHRSISTPIGEPLNERRDSKQQHHSPAPSKAAGNSNSDSKGLKRGRKVSSSSKGDDGPQQLATSLAGQAGERSTMDGTNHSTSWFKQVCLSLVRLLSGVKSDEVERRRMELSASERARDKQLEMLAGRIDNWYTGDGGGGGGDCDGSPSPPPPPPSQAEPSKLTEPLNPANLASGLKAAEKPASNGAKKSDAGQVNELPGLREEQVNGAKFDLELENLESSNSAGDEKARQQELPAPMANRAGLRDAKLLEADSSGLDEQQFNQGDKAVDKAATDDTSEGDGDGDGDESLAGDNSDGANEQERAPTACHRPFGSVTKSPKLLSDKTNALERMEAALIV